MPSQKAPTVAVIMSTYNGGKYLEAQLDSILQQIYPHIDIYIRDDGSTDGTLSILYRYAKKHPQIHLEAGKNLGFAPSFLKVLSSANGYDYYAFCDQDDIWLDFKIQRALEYLMSYSNNRLLLYGSSYDFYDANLNFCEHAKIPKRLGSFIVSTTEGLVLGTCMVINQPTREALLRADATKIYAHDWFTYMLCSTMGEVIYDSTPTIKYRRTGNNASPGGLSFLQLQIYRIKNFLVGPRLQKIHQQNQHFAELFYMELTPSDQKTINLLTGKRTVPKQLKKTFYPKRWRCNLFDEVLLRLLFLIGKM